jgi:hypothetical protein
MYSSTLKEESQFKLNVPYRPFPLKYRQLPPDGYDYGIEVHIPGKEVSTKGFLTEEKAREYLRKVRQLQETGIVLYTRILRRNPDFSTYPNSTRIKPVAGEKGKHYCPECNDYTVYHKDYGYEGTDSKHCQYCGLSDNDWWFKSLNGLWKVDK